jgi:DNA end-binding protein Ku
MRMAARSIGSLTISFGLVAIPVKLYSARQWSGKISFNLLHKTCGSRVREQYVCIREDVVVGREELVKGYEFAKDQYVSFTPEEIKALEEVGTQSVDVEEFVPIESIDPLYFERTYYLAPDKGGAKPYSLFTRALTETKRSAVGRWATRGQQHVVALRPMGNVLVMQQLLFASEVRPVSELEVSPADVREPELKLALQLIEQQTARAYDPAAYTDEVKARIEAAIQRKVEGQEISVSEARPAQTAQVIDLMAALRASLDRSTSAQKETSRLGARKPAKRVQKSPATPAAKKTARRS